MNTKINDKPSPGDILLRNIEVLQGLRPLEQYIDATQQNEQQQQSTKVRVQKKKK